MIIGQTTLLSKIDSYTLDTLPKQLMFIGEKGCGKHFFANYISKKFNLNTVVINENIESETLIEYSQTPINTLFVIEIYNYTEKQQNKFLKFIEEPNKNSFIVILSESEVGVLPTILNRCTKLTFEKYTVEQLQTFRHIDNELVYKFCNTPGKIKFADGKSFNELYSLCENIVNNITKASFVNTLSIYTKINYKEEYNKFDFDLFFEVLAYVAYKDFEETNSDTSYKVGRFCTNFYAKRLNKNINKDSFMLNFLSNLWKVVR